jgi:hypothetical protein
MGTVPGGFVRGSNRSISSIHSWWPISTIRDARRRTALGDCLLQEERTASDIAKQNAPVNESKKAAKAGRRRRALSIRRHAIGLLVFVELELLRKTVFDIALGKVDGFFRVVDGLVEIAALGVCRCQ